jgi:hypothetical protein
MLSFVWEKTYQILSQGLSQTTFDGIIHEIGQKSWIQGLVGAEK